MKVLCAALALFFASLTIGFAQIAKIAPTQTHSPSIPSSASTTKPLQLPASNAKPIRLKEPRHLLAKTSRSSVVTWPFGKTIQYGQLLSDALYGGSALVPGIFTYSPDLGYVPARGRCHVTVTFRPTDPANLLASTHVVVVKVQ